MKLQHTTVGQGHWYVPSRGAGEAPVHRPRAGQGPKGKPVKVRHSHSGQSPKGGNSHFFVEIRSDFFKKLNMVQSHREIFNVLSDEMKNGLHALRIKIRN